MNTFHTPVLLKEIVDFLDVKKDKRYIDATIGGGGHSFGILRLGGIVLGIDWDEEAIEYVKKILRNKDIRILSERKDKTLNISISQYLNITLVHGNFKEIDKIARSKGFDKAFGIVFDLGVSSYQLEASERGFSFQKEGPLDMRMDKNLAVKAADLINILTKGELYELFTKLGEERYAHAISNNIVRARRIKPIETTGELVRIVKEVARGTFGIHPATRVFQALRIAVNDELNNLRQALPKALELLEKEGILAVISFHSLEDRIVKNSFNQFQKEGLGTVLTKKPVIPSLEERKRNKRSRSAKLRVFRKN